MTFTAQQKFAIPFLQAIIRGYLARKLIKQMKSARFLSDYYRFRLYFRSYLKKVVIVQRAVFLFLVALKIKRYAIRYKAVRRLQRWYSHYYLLKRAILRVKTMKLWNEIQLFAIVRAKKKLIPTERYRYILYKFMRSFIEKQRIRRL